MSTQPLALSAGALPAVSRATSARGAAATCRAFGVTHDVGVGVLLWMFNLTKHMLPNYADNSWPPERYLRPETLMVHGVRADSKHANFSAVHAYFEVWGLLSISRG